MLQDLKLAQAAFPKNHDISIVLETLQLSHDALSQHPSELAGQLVGRIHGYGAQTVTMVTEAKALLADEGSLEEESRTLVTGLVEGLETLMAKLDARNKVKMLYMLS